MGEVEVEADADTDLGAGLRRCELCRKRLEEAGLIDLLKAVNWRLGFNLKTLVSSLLVIWISVPDLCVLIEQQPPLTLVVAELS